MFPLVVINKQKKRITFNKINLSRGIFKYLETIERSTMELSSKIAKNLNSLNTFVRSTIVDVRSCSK